MSTTKPKSSKSPTPKMLGPDDTIGEGDSKIIYASEDPTSGARHHAKALPNFHALKDEVHWQKMYHQTGEVPRLVCCQGHYQADGSMPLYRHPSDQALPLLPYSPLVKEMSEHVASLVGHPVNHCLIQLYRDGQDFISEHSDKTLDIVRGSYIVNVSLGAERTMRLRTKRPKVQDGDPGECPLPRATQHIPLPHGSIFLLGPKTNTTHLHSIPPSKQPTTHLTAPQTAYNRQRISLTFRHIGTFLDASRTLIWGQGARGKTRDEANEVVNGDARLARELVGAFGLENRSGEGEWDWERVYGDGFDVVDFV